MSSPIELARGADAVVQTLIDHGVDTVFGLCGHGDLAMLDAMSQLGVRFISVHHEQVAVHAADAYYRLTRKPGVVVTTVGSGMLNTMAGLADALADSSAVLVISGLAPSRYVGLGAYQEMDLHGDDEQWLASRPVVKRSYRVSDPLGLPSVVNRALYEAAAGAPGPVHVHVPLDFWFSRAEFSQPQPIATARPCLPGATATAIVEQLRNATRPVIYAGGGVLSAGASPLLRDLAHAVDAPVVTSMRGQGAIPQDDPLALGFTGVVGSAPANYAVRHADVVLGIATRFDEMDTSSWSAEFFLDPRATKLIQIDIDPQRIGRVFRPAIGAVADAETALGQLAAEAGDCTADHARWRGELAEQVRDWNAVLDASYDVSETPLQTAAVLRGVRAVLPANGILISGVGARHLIGQHFPVLAGGSLLTASGCSTMGWEPGAMLGAAVASGGRPVLGMIGDGSFNSTASALSTAVAQELDAVWVILDNGGYQSIALYQDRHFGGRIGTDFTYASGKPYQIDYVGLARAYGAVAETATSVADVQAAVQRGLERGGSYVVHVPISGKPRANATGHWDVNDIMAGETRRVPQPWRPAAGP